MMRHPVTCRHWQEWRRDGAGWQALPACDGMAVSPATTTVPVVGVVQSAEGGTIPRIATRLRAMRWEDAAGVDGDRLDSGLRTMNLDRNKMITGGLSLDTGNGGDAGCIDCGPGNDTVDVDRGIGELTGCEIKIAGYVDSAPNELPPRDGPPPGVASRVILAASPRCAGFAASAAWRLAAGPLAI